MWLPCCAPGAPCGPPMPALDKTLTSALLRWPAVIVTRPAAEASAWVADLQARGIPAEALPLIEIASAPDSMPARACWTDITSYAAVMFVSGNAVEQFFAARPVTAVGAAVSALPTNLRFMAPGPGTARRLLAAGVPAAQIDTPGPDAAQFDSQALWEVIGQRPWAAQRVLIVRGQSGASLDAEPAQGDTANVGRDFLARRWLDSGAAVDFVSVYIRRAPRLDAAAMSRIQRSQIDGSVWLFSSSEALSYVPTATSPNWSLARAIATHPRIAQAAREAGWGVVIESRPALADIVASIESLLP